MLFWVVQSLAHSKCAVTAMHYWAELLNMFQSILFYGAIVFEHGGEGRYMIRGCFKSPIFKALTPLPQRFSSLKVHQNILKNLYINIDTRYRPQRFQVNCSGAWPKHQYYPQALRWFQRSVREFVLWFGYTVTVCAVYWTLTGPGALRMEGGALLFIESIPTSHQMTNPSEASDQIRKGGLPRSELGNWRLVCFLLWL